MKSAGKGVEIIVLESLFVFRTLHEFWNGILYHGLVMVIYTGGGSTYTRHEFENGNLGFLK